MEVFRFDKVVKKGDFDPPCIAVVGPCAAGKSTLTPALQAAGYEARQPAQEHSCVPNMWQRLTNPDILIYLDLTYREARARRPHIDGGPKRLMEQHQRLAHARNHCDYYLDTSDLTPHEVREEIFIFLNDWHSGKKRVRAKADRI